MNVSSLSLMKSFACGAAIVAAALLVVPSPNRVLAQATAPAPVSPTDAADATDGPVLVASIAGTSKLSADVMYVSGLVNQPNSGNMFAMMAGMFTQGIDPSQPVRVMVMMIDDAPEPIVYIPAADVKVMLKRLEGQTGPVDVLPDGTMAFLVNNNTVFIEQREGVAVMARSREVLADAPQDLTETFDGMGNNYDLAMRVQIQQVPENLRQLLVDQVRRGYDQSLQGDDEQDAEVAAQAESAIAQLEQVIDESDELFFGFNVDSAAGEIVVDFSFTGVPGSNLAKMYNVIKPIPSSFASVIRQDAAAYYHTSATVSPEAAEQSRISIETSMGGIERMIKDADEITDQQADELIGVIRRVINLTIDSMAEGKQDIGALLLADDNQMQFVLGAFVSDGGEAAKILQDVAEKVDGLGDAPTFSFNRGEYNGVTMHLVTADVPADEDEARKMFGDQLKLHVGTAEKAVYVALGDQSVPTLKKLIDNAHTDTSSDRSVGTMKVNLLPLLYYIQSIEASPPVEAMITSLTSGQGSGVFELNANEIPDGQKSRISVSSEVIRAIGAAVQQTQLEAMKGDF